MIVKVEEYNPETSRFWTTHHTSGRKMDVIVDCATCLNNSDFGNGWVELCEISLYLKEPGWKAMSRWCLGQYNMKWFDSWSWLLDGCVLPTIIFARWVMCRLCGKKVVVILDNLCSTLVFLGVGGTSYCVMFLYLKGDEWQMEPRWCFLADIICLYDVNWLWTCPDENEWQESRYDNYMTCLIYFRFSKLHDEKERKLLHGSSTWRNIPPPPPQFRQ